MYGTHVLFGVGYGPNFEMLIPPPESTTVALLTAALSLTRRLNVSPVTRSAAQLPRNWLGARKAVYGKPSVVRMYAPGLPPEATQSGSVGVGVGTRKLPTVQPSAPKSNVLCTSVCDPSSGA